MNRLRAGFGRVWSVARWFALTLVVLVVLPFLLVPVFAYVNPPVSALMLWRTIEGHGIEQRWVALDDIAPSLPATVIMMEDGRFCAHRGVDWGAVREAMGEAGRRGEPRGASTIPMQTAKNLFLWPHRSYVRKALEVPLAYWIDLAWGKRRTIEIYLNIVEWGPGIYGAEAAASHHFGRPARALTWQQSAQLAAVLPSPLLRSAGKPGRITREIAARALARGRQAGAYIGCIR